MKYIPDERKVSMVSKLRLLLLLRRSQSTSTYSRGCLVQTLRKELCENRRRWVAAYRRRQARRRLLLLVALAAALMMWNFRQPRTLWALPR